MFVEYLYYSTVSNSVVNAARTLVERVSKTLSEDALVIEIASNDGYLLQFYDGLGIQVLGIDPARGPANEAALKGIPTVQDFFSLKLAKQLPKADVIHANNVLAHVPSTNDFVAGIAEVLKPDGVCIVEVPYFGDLISKGNFDTIYHEHVFYFSFKSLAILFGRNGLHIQEVEHLESQGGSLRITASKNGTSCQFEEWGLEGVPTLQQQVDEIAVKLKSTLLKLKEKGKRVWGFGAAAKATVMMNYCNIDHTLIEAVADDAPAKFQKFIPGTRTEVLYPKNWLEARPDYTCIFSWNYAQEIMERFKYNYEGKFFIPTQSDI
jgi:SAM-dependent methyltransferase